MQSLPPRIWRVKEFSWIFGANYEESQATRSCPPRPLLKLIIEEGSVTSNYFLVIKQIGKFYTILHKVSLYSSKYNVDERSLITAY